MGMDLAGMIFLQKKGLLTAERNRILDIGPQNVYVASEDKIKEFLRLQDVNDLTPEVEAEIKRLSYFSTPRPEERTTLFSEVTDLTNIEYNSFDVCPALKTELLDLNYDALPEKHAEYYDVVLNFGTTEHVFNQWNSFRIMHEALKVGGVVYHQLPASGYLDHGYYCYTPLFFEELARANDYAVEAMFLTPAGENNVISMGLDVRASDAGLLTPHSFDLQPTAQRVPCFNIHVVFRKTVSAPFRVGLEIATAHASAYQEILGRYGDTMQSTPGAQSDDRLEAFIVDRDRKISEIVADRERKIRELVEEREAIIAALVAERDRASTERDELAAKVQAKTGLKSWLKAPFSAEFRLRG